MYHFCTDIKKVNIFYIFPHVDKFMFTWNRTFYLFCQILLQVYEKMVIEYVVVTFLSRLLIFCSLNFYQKLLKLFTIF